MNRLDIIIVAILVQISLGATQLDIGQSSTLIISSNKANKAQTFYVSLENFPDKINEGAILVQGQDADLKEIIEIKSNFVDQITEEFPNNSNSLILDEQNMLNEIIFKFPRDKQRKKYFLFSLENKREEELELTLTPLKFPQEHIVKSGETTKLNLHYEDNVPIYYQLKIEFTGDFINSILYCEEENFLIIQNEITQETLEKANNKTVSVFKKDSFISLILKIYSKNKDGDIKFYFEFTNKKVIYLQNYANKYYQTEFEPSDKEDIYIINTDDSIMEKYILFKQIFSQFNENFVTFYSSEPQIENGVLTILPTDKNQDKKIENNEYISCNSKYQTLLIQHKNYGQAKYIFVNKGLSNFYLGGEDFIYLEKDKSLAPRIDSSKGLNFRFLHLYGGKVSYKLESYDLLFKEDCYGYVGTNAYVQFIIKAKDNCIIQTSFLLGEYFKMANENSIITTNIGILALLKQNIEYTTFQIIIEAKYEDSNEDIELIYSKGVTEKEQAVPFPLYAGSSKSVKNRIEINEINPYLFSNYRLKKDKIYYSFCNKNLKNAIYNITINYNQKSCSNDFLPNNTLIKIEKNKQYNLEGSNYNNSYITYFLLSLTNNTKTLTFKYYDIKMDLFSLESSINIKQYPLFYQNSSITLEGEEDAFLYYSFNNVSVNEDLINNFSQKANGLEFKCIFDGMILNWNEPLEGFEYDNLTIYVYDTKKDYNFINFTEEEKNNATKIVNRQKKEYSYNFTDILKEDENYYFYVSLEYNIEDIPISLLTSASIRENESEKSDDEKSDDKKSDDEKSDGEKSDGETSDGENNGEKNEGDSKTILLIVIPSAIVLIIAIFLIIYFLRKRKRQQNNINISVEPLVPGAEMM